MKFAKECGKQNVSPSTAKPSNHYNSYFMLFRTIIALLFLCLSTSFSFGQKIGHLNSVKFLDSLSESKAIADQISNYEKSLSETGEKMYMKFEQDVNKYREDVQAGSLTPAQQKQRESDLEIQQNAIAKYQNDAKDSLLKRRDELLKPLLDKINTILVEIGKEENFLFIFDSSVGSLYAPASLDVTDKVLKKLSEKK